ncbi:efflux RND transporter periplasmic adaptor subunit [Sphingobacterium psychroaquaticum]|uniref:efflux RND transporter periplasmic adaptor subunit n=1 Tax=Sphingobacterium psychroaquaticum TaxID=561061 RepID=UPI001068F0EA|nr:efflux RND transporter periplasmic adaptor subunit [Sphingobacterium psychroaquaticum]QBQ41725.1 efflux RND transporter periplasmic adaptor subunit [Sphingobacterium psychroaquaticum]
MKKLFFSSIILSLILQACSEPKAATEATTVPSLPVYTVNEADAHTIKEYPAAIRGITDIEIRTQVGGTLERVYVDEGAYVTKGQLLFKINERPFREQLNITIANVNAAKAALINTQLEIDKLTPLVQNKVVSDFQLKSAQAAHQVALSNLEQAKAMVENAKIDLGYSNVHAPVSGYIGRLPKRQGSLLSPTDVEALTTVSNVSQVYVYFSLGEIDFIQFKNQNLGTTLSDKVKNLPPVTLELADKSAYQEVGKIDVVNGQFDPNTGSIMLRATFPNPQGILRSGNTGKIQLKIKHDHAILVPQEATVEVQDKVFVYALDGANKVTKKQIQIVGRSGNNYLIGDELQSGDRIVHKGFDRLQDGMQIAPETKKVLAAKTN